MITIVYRLIVLMVLIFVGYDFVKSDKPSGKSRPAWSWFPFCCAF